jgi:hypothetical protein
MSVWGASSLRVEGDAMKSFCLAALLAVSAGFCFGQAPKASLNVPSTDVYVGYIATSPDYGASLFSYRLNGFEGAYSKGLNPHIYAIASGAFVFGTNYSVKQFSGTVGAKVNVLTGKFRPYITGQVGYARQSSSSKIGGMYAGDHHPPLASNATDVEDGLTYRVGIGGDLQLTSKIYWRMLQWDMQPQPWGRHTPFYNNFSSGVGYRF